MSQVLPPAFGELQQAVALFSADGHPEECNPAAEHLLGYSQSEFPGLTLADLIAPRADLDRSQVHDHITNAVAGDRETFEWQIQRANGEPRWVQVTASPLALDDTRYVLGEFRDLTAYKARGRRLQLLYRVLRHNLRNEMNVIQGHATDLQQAITDNDIERQVEIIKETASDVGELSETVADLERLVEQDAAERQRMNVAEIVHMVVTELKEEYPEATIEVSVEEETYVSADEGFRLALEHAIINAVEHNDADDPRVTITHDATDDEAVISIADNGPGIPEMEIKALSSEATALEHGSGLGLSIIQWCTRALGGDITVDTTDAGSNLTIRLPRLA